MKNKGTVVAGVAVIIAVVVIGIVVLSLRGEQLSATAKTLIIQSLVTTVIGGSVPALLALQRIEAVQHDINNGVVTEKVKEGTKEAITEMAEDPMIDTVTIQGES